MTDEEFKRLFEAAEERRSRATRETRRYFETHVKLDRRVRTLEQAFADLQSRVERLEATTH